MIQLTSTIVENPCGKPARQTTCQIDVDGFDTVVAVADQFMKDADDRFMGQKAAFEKAIAQFPKDIREQLWEQFKSRSKRSRKYYNI